MNQKDRNDKNIIPDSRSSMQSYSLTCYRSERKAFSWLLVVNRRCLISLCIFGTRLQREHGAEEEEEEEEVKEEGGKEQEGEEEQREEKMGRSRGGREGVEEERVEEEEGEGVEGEGVEDEGEGGER